MEQDLRQRPTRVSLRHLPLRHDHTHLIDAEGSESGGQQTGGTQDVPPVEEAEGNSFHDAVEAETHQGQSGEELHAQRRPRGRVFLAHDELQREDLTLWETDLRRRSAWWGIPERWNICESVSWRKHDVCLSWAPAQHWEQRAERWVLYTLTDLRLQKDPRSARV